MQIYLKTCTIPGCLKYHHTPFEWHYRGIQHMINTRFKGTF